MADSTTAPRESLQALEPRAPLTARRVTRALARAVGVFGVVFGLQALPVALAQLPEFVSPWGVVVVVAVYLGLAAGGVTAAVNRKKRISARAIAAVYLVAVISWPFMVADPATFADSTPWIWYLCTVATANAAIGFRLPIAIVYTLITPLAYGIIRVLPAGGDVGTMRAVFDSVYALILSAAVLIILATLVQAAQRVDAAQAAALAEYSAAVRQHALDAERMEVDSIVHDSVLTTFLSAAAARSEAERNLAVVMARAAEMRFVRAADVPDAAVGGLNALMVRIRSAIAVGTEPVSLHVGELGDALLPVPVADALYSATVQALMNSLQHAGGTGVPQAIRRGVHVSAVDGGCRIEISDDGVGFVPEAVPAERMGLRVSIVERMAAVGGRATIRSQPGQGTAITLVWAPVSEPEERE